MITLGATGGDTVTMQVVVKGVASYDANGNGVRAENVDPLDIQGDVQPIGGSTLRDLPEGLSEKVEKMVWTYHDVKVDNILVIDGVDYEVFKTWPFRHEGVTKSAIGVLRDDR